MPKIVLKTVVGSSPSRWYGTLVTSGISYEDGSRVTIQNKLYVKFLAPTNTGIQLNALLDPWQEVKYTIETETIDDQTVGVTAEIHIDGPYTFNTSDTLTWNITGDLTGDASRCTNSFELYVDELPSGAVEIEVPAVPEGVLSSIKQTISLTKGGRPLVLSATPGQTTSFTVVTGQYKVSVGELVDENETICVAESVSPTDIIVEAGSTASLTVSYGTPQKFSALDIKVGGLPSPLDKEQLHIQASPAAILRYDHNRSHSDLENTKYTWKQSVDLFNSLIKVYIESDKFSSANIDTSSFVDLPINLTTDVDPSEESIALRVVSKDRTAYVYSKEVAIKSGNITLGTPVAPGKYNVTAAGFIKDGMLYGADMASEIVVAPDGSSKIDLAILRGPNLLVRGFPSYLSFGALSDLVDLQGEDLAAAKVTSVFKYAGNDGAGDAGEYLSDDPATTKTVQLAASVSEKLDGQPVLPVLISYTVNLSLGDSNRLLQDEFGLGHSFGNLILSLQLAKKASKNEITAGYIVNPDFLGDNQQAGRTAEYSMPVVRPLTKALAYRKIDVVVPSTISNTLAGYVHAVNWLIRTVAPEVTFGWQANLWGVGSSAWIYDRNDDAAAVKNAKSTAAYIKTLGVFDGDYAPDFLAIDRYEADDFTQRAYANSYCYGPREWDRFYDFVRTVALELKVPVMPWQIPASRIPHADENVTTGSLESDHWGTGGTYVFGDPAIGKNFENIHPVVRNIQPGALVQQDRVASLFDSTEPFDLGVPAWGDFPLRGIFSVLLGGGSSTGVVKSIGSTGKWTQGKISEYMEDPVPLTSTPKSRAT